MNHKLKTINKNGSTKTTQPSDMVFMLKWGNVFLLIILSLKEKVVKITNINPKKILMKI